MIDRTTCLASFDKTCFMKANSATVGDNGGFPRRGRPAIFTSNEGFDVFSALLAALLRINKEGRPKRDRLTVRNGDSLPYCGSNSHQTIKLSRFK